MTAQLYQTWKTQVTEGISLIMLAGFIYIQLTFAQVGYKSKEWALFWGMAISFLVTTTIVVLVIYFQHLG